MSGPSAEPTLVELFTPKLVTVLRERYRFADLRADAIAGLTVAIVALPLSMAIAIASGVSPDRGLYTAIVGGFVVSLLGGSRFQIGGPAGAFIVLVLATVEQHGLDGLILATALSGVILLAIAFLRLGTFIKYIPFPVTVGFTAGIAVIIFASQIRELLGVTIQGTEPGPLIPKLAALGNALPSLNPAAVAISAFSVAVIVALRRFRPHWPGVLIAVALAAVGSYLAQLPVETIGTRFGGIPNSLPAPQLPVLSIEKIVAVLPAALSFALLGAIESLLSAVVADSMTGRRHRSNCELGAQGAANIASALFGGFCVTGTIARTATNVRSGARGPVAGMLHAVFLLAFMIVAAPLASYIPLAALAAVLAVVAWNMAEKHEFATLLRASRGDAVVLLTTFLLVVFRDLTEGILVGFGIGALLFLHRMSQAVKIETARPLVEEDVPDTVNGNGRKPYDQALATDPDVVVYRISGAFFFGTAASVAAALDRIGDHPKAYVIDVSAVPILDSTGAATIEGFVRKAHRKGATVYIAGAQSAIRRVLLIHGLRPPRVRFKTSLPAAVAAARDQAAASASANAGRATHRDVTGSTRPTNHSVFLTATAPQAAGVPYQTERGRLTTGSAMRIEDYRRQAEECRSLARNIPGGHYREQLLNMAVTWEALAIERERQVNLNASVDAHPEKAT
jgi:SulP family sulfate permease